MAFVGKYKTLAPIESAFQDFLKACCVNWGHTGGRPTWLDGQSGGRCAAANVESSCIKNFESTVPGQTLQIPHFPPRIKKKKKKNQTGDGVFLVVVTMQASPMLPSSHFDAELHSTVQNREISGRGGDGCPFHPRSLRLPGVLCLCFCWSFQDF